MDASDPRRASELDAEFVDVVDEHGSMVLSIATRIGDIASAEEIAQETFLRAYRALVGGSTDWSEVDVRPWLATITLNLVRNEARRRRRKPTRSLSRRAEEDAVDRTSAEDHVIRDSVDPRLVRSLERLPAAQREAVVLRHVIGLSTAETAAAMGCPAGTVKSHVSRGLAALRRSMCVYTEES